MATETGQTIYEAETSLNLHRNIILKLINEGKILLDTASMEDSDFLASIGRDS